MKEDDQTSQHSGDSDDDWDIAEIEIKTTEIGHHIEKTPEIITPRRTTRINAGVHPNPHNLPRSKCIQTQISLSSPNSNFSALSDAIATLDSSLGKSLGKSFEIVLVIV